MNKNITVALLFPFLKRNTTSIKRFNSVVDCFYKSAYRVKVFESIPPNFDISTVGLFQGSTHYKKELEEVSCSRNFLQKLYFSNSRRPKLLSWAHYLLFKTDIFYNPSILNNLLKLDNRQAAVVAFGGPFSVFLAASDICLKKKWTLVLDYRDPWTFGYKVIGTNRFLFSIWRTLLRRHEKRLLKIAKIVTTVSPTLKSYFPKEFQHKIHVIPNGANYEPVISEVNGVPDVFTIFYAGTIYNDQLKDETFFKSLNQFLVGKDDRKIRLIFAGASKSRRLIKVVNKYKLLSLTTILPRLEAAEVTPYFVNASLFLHLRYGDRSGIITSKQADYLAWRKPILLPVSDNGDLAESIIEHKAGFVCNGVEETLAVLEQQWQKFLNKESIIIDQDEEFLRKNTRTYWAEQFVKLIEEKVFPEDTF